MIVGKIDFKNPDRRFRFDVNWTNYRDCLYDYALEKKHVVLVCRQCGQMLAPFVELAGPRACGWRKAGNKLWYCHQCYFHNGGLWDGSEEDKELFEEEVKKRNDKTKRLILRYQFYHPWVKRIRYK